MSDQGAPGGQAPNGSTPQQGQAPAGGTQQGQAPAGDGQNGNQPGQAPGQGGQGNQQQQGDNGTPDLSAIADPTLRAWVEAQAREAREARQEAARYRTERNNLNQQVTQFQRQNETAEQAAQRQQAEREQAERDRQAEIQRLQDENRSLRVGQVFTTAATAAHALDPAALLSLIGGPSKVQLDDQGKPTNLDALIDQARQQYPWAFSRTSADAGGGGGQQPLSTGGMNDFIRGRR